MLELVWSSVIRQEIASPDYLAVILVLATAALAIITFFYMRETRGIRRTSQRAAEAQESANRAQENYFQLSAMTEIFKILGSPEHIEARKLVYEGHGIYRRGKTSIWQTEKFGKSAQRLLTEFGMVASLYKINLVPRDAFLEVYWGVILLCWQSLELLILEERNKRKNSIYMANFERLKEAAEAYRVAHYADVKPELYSRYDQKI